MRIKSLKNNLWQIAFNLFHPTTPMVDVCFIIGNAKEHLLFAHMNNNKDILIDSIRNSPLFACFLGSCARSSGYFYVRRPAQLLIVQYR